jgi:hypothetical protein
VNVTAELVINAYVCSLCSKPEINHVVCPTNQLHSSYVHHHSIKDMHYEDLMRNGGPDENRMLKCEQRSTVCKKLPAFRDNPERVKIMVC